MEKIRRLLPLVGLISFIIVWSSVIYYISPEEIVEFLGIKNGYIVAFVVSLVGGLSTLINFPYQLIIFTLGAGGLNPIFLGIIAGSGVMVGDSISYFIGFRGRSVLPDKLLVLFKKLYHWCLKCPPWLVPVALYLYGALIPFPNDLIVIPLGLARYSYWALIIPLGLGNITFNVLVALLGWYSYEWF